MRGKFFALLISVIFVLLAVGCTTTQSPEVIVLPLSTPSPDDQPSTGLQDEDLVRISDGGGVVVEVTPLNLDAPADTLDFQISMDTHTVELDYDFLEIAVLLDDLGNSYTPTSWDGPQGGHHLSGILRFSSGADVLRSDVTFVELELRGIAGVPVRIFRWDL